MDVAVWLRSLGLGKYEAAFRENEITERVLPSLTQEDLKEIGVGPVGHRRIILEAIATLRADTQRGLRARRSGQLMWSLRQKPCHSQDALPSRTLRAHRRGNRTGGHGWPSTLGS
jgi:hypothetical protein